MENKTAFRMFILKKLYDFTGVKFVVGMVTLWLISHTADNYTSTLLFLTAMVTIFGRAGLEFASIWKGKLPDKTQEEG